MSLPSAKELSTSLRAARWDIAELVLFGGAMISLGFWIGTEYAWRASWAIERGAIGDVIDYSFFAAFFLLVLMGAVDVLAEQRA